MKYLEIDLPLIVVTISVSFNLLFAGIMQENADMHNLLVIIGIALLLFSYYEMIHIAKR